MRKQLVSGKKLLLFVDTGDNCRCPLAIGYLQKLLQQKNIDYIEVRHMGVMTPNDLLPTPEVVQLLKEEGVDIRYHRSRPINDDLIRQADLVLGFTAIHVQTCYRKVPECKSKTFLLKEYVGLAHTGDQIHDPMGSTMEIFKKYFNEIKQSLQRLVEMEFITESPDPKEVVIMPTIVKPKSTDTEDEELPAGYYNEEELALQAAKAAKAKSRLKALQEMEDGPAAAAKKKTEKAKETPKKEASKPKAVKTEKVKEPASDKKAAKEAPGKKPAPKAAKAEAKPAKAEKPSPKAAAKPAGKSSAAKPAAKAAAKPAPAKAKAGEKPAPAKVKVAAKAAATKGKAAPAKKSRK